MTRRFKNKYFDSIRRYLKIRIFGRDQDEAEDQPTGILKYVEDLIRGLNADIGRKDFFEIASKEHKEIATMKDEWIEKLACAIQCDRCNEKMEPKDPRILSVYDHQAICMACKKEEESRSDYEAVSKNTIGQCMIDTELQYSDPAGFCYHHFYPYTC